MNHLVAANEKVVINVSGMHFETWTWTLSRFPNTLLGNPCKRRKYFDYIHNEYFFERHRQSFESILYYYQSNGKFLIRPLSVSSEVFFDEIVFFELGRDVINKYKKQEGFFIDREANVRDLPRNKLKRSIWLLFEYPGSSIYARIIAIISVIIITVSIALFCIETLPEVKARRSHLSPSPTTTPPMPLSALPSGQTDNTQMNLQLKTTTPSIMTTSILPSHASVTRDEFFIIETICIIWFSTELLMRFYASPNKIAFIKHPGNIIDFLSIMPYFMQTSDSAKFSILRIIRLVRVFRVFKLARHFKGLQILGHTLRASANELSQLGLFLFTGVVLFSSCIYFVELDHVKSDFNSIPDGFWFAIITMTTVGYGEMVPKTPLGRLVGSFCAIAGVLTIALPVPIIVSHFQFFYQGNQVLKKVSKETLKASYRDDESIADSDYSNSNKKAIEENQNNNADDAKNNTSNKSRFFRCFNLKQFRSSKNNTSSSSSNNNINNNNNGKEV